MTEMAGYRVLRTVRDEPDRRVLAAFGDEAVELHAATADAADALADEGAALTGFHHPHVVPMLDAASVEGLPVLVRPSFERTLADWIVVRGAPEPGEVVTALAPVAEAVGALHASGRSGARLDLRHVVLDGDGAPALIGVGVRRSTTRPTAAWRSADPGVQQDCSALALLVDDLLAAAGAIAPPALVDALAARDAAAAGHALLDAWAPLPLEPGVRHVAPVRRSRERVRATSADASRLVRLTQRALAQLSLVRRPVWVAAGAGAVALLAALTIPAVASDGGAATSTTVLGEPTADPDARPDADAEADPAATPIAPGSDATAVVAAESLLAGRERCLERSDDACLTPLVDATGGILLSTWRLPADATVTETAVLGDAVLLAVASDSEPASVLVVRTDAGWLLRDAWAG